MSTLDEYLQSQLEALEKDQLKRTIITSYRYDNAKLIQADAHYLSFSCNDYLGLSQHHTVIQAAAEALQRYGVGAGASRLITGNSPLYDELEQALALFKNTQSACIFGSGFLANLGVITTLMADGDLIIADKYSHACMIDGAQLSGATLKRFKHNDMAHLELLLKKHRAEYRHCLIMSETVFSMDGDLAPLDEINALAKRYDAWVLSDDAHGLGVVKSVAVDIQMGTLSKAAGGYGGYVCGSKTVIDALKSKARSLIYSTGLPPATLAASIAALQVMKDEPERAKKALGNARYFTEALGLQEAQSCIVPVILGSAKAALDASLQLKEQGFLVSAIRPPTVPKGSSRLRFAFSANHATSDIERLIKVITNAGWLEYPHDQRMDATA